jgi:hypothetical protein
MSAGCATKSVIGNRVVRSGMGPLGAPW